MIKSKVSIIKNKDLKTFALNHKKRLRKLKDCVFVVFCDSKLCFFIHLIKIDVEIFFTILERDRISLCNLGCSETHDPPASVFPVQRLETCTIDR